MEKRRKGKEKNSEERRGRDDGIRGGLEKTRGKGEPKGRGEGTKMSFFFIQSRIILKNCRDKGSSKD